MKILFLHGWQSVPGGVKPTFLAQHGHEVLNPALPDDNFEEAVNIAQAEFDRHRPQVVVGSSRDGAVAMNIKISDARLVLLCPAWKKYGTAKTVKPGTVVLHSKADAAAPDGVLTTKGLTTMATPREPWNIRPAKKRASITASFKTEVESKAKELIENVLKPRYVMPPPPKEKKGNYIIDIGAKWYRGYFYFFTTYACPSPNALSPTFEWTFARMEPLRGGKFALYAMRYTGKEWVGVLDALSVDECMKAIQDDEWFAL